MVNIEEKIKNVLKKHNLLTIQDYAKKRNISIWYARKLCRDGKINCQKATVSGNEVWFIKEDQK